MKFFKVCQKHTFAFPFHYFKINEVTDGAVKDKCNLCNDVTLQHIFLTLLESVFLDTEISCVYLIYILTASVYLSH